MPILTGVAMTIAPAQQTLSSGSPSIPESVLTAKRTELDNLELKLIWGELPQDLNGHVFITAPVGSVTSDGLPYPDGTPITNGGGMVYRFDFDKPGKVFASAKLVKPPCYYADDATQPGTQYEKYKFNNFGMGRFSWSLGLKNELNTAFLPMRFAGEENNRLLVCWDGGRPYEIDPVSLATITPLGSNKEWRPEAQTPFKFVFKPVMSSAHPYFDIRAKDENNQPSPAAFTVNYGKSLKTILKTLPCPFELFGLPSFLDRACNNTANFIERDRARKGFCSQFLQWLWQLILTPISWIAERIADMKDIVYLIRWDGKGDVERWTIVKEDGSPMTILQTMHQIGVTENYILFMDTAFQFGIGQLLNNPLPNNPGAERLLRALITSPQLPDAILYIVRRSDLKNGQYPARGGSEVKVKARKVVIPREAIHFLENYENPDNQIVLHIGHVCAWEGSEWVHTYDTFASNPSQLVPPRVRGMISEEMDISYVGRYVLDGETGEILKQDVIKDFTCTWGISFFAYRTDPQTGMMPAKLDNIYWTSLGLWEESLTHFLWDLTKDYPYRTVSPEDLLLYGEEGVQPCVFRVYTAEDSIEIRDRFQFPDEFMVNSIQFIPCGTAEDDSTKGYISCTVFSPNHNELWIFDGENLAQGPLCKLSHPSFDFGFTTHSTWLPAIAPRTAAYNINVRQDYDPLVKAKKNPQIEQLFETEVYPHFE
ncbi:carotenoid oxygenase family protein [Lusitaniella coriacea]|uniref:carotenoid oxygenase family protein n=1 Tax=Lusitaniella coriacea TaxID=1983105 RepID=UPI003CF08005